MNETPENLVLFGALTNLGLNPDEALASVPPEKREGLLAFAHSYLHLCTAIPGERADELGMLLAEMFQMAIAGVMAATYTPQAVST